MKISKIISGSYFENSSSILLTRMSLSCSSMIITIFIARLLGPEQLGLFSIAMGLCMIFQYISILGYDTVTVREIAREPNKGGGLIQHGVVLGILSCFIGTPLMCVIGKILHYSPDVMKSIYISSFVLFPSYLNLLVETIFIGLKKARFSFYTAIIRELTWLILSIWWLNISKDINAVIVAFIVSRVVGVFLLTFFLQQERIKWWKDFHWFEFKEIIGLIPTFLFINILSNILLEVDVIVLSKFVPIVDVGFYNVAKKILRVSLILIFSLVSALFPIIVETMHKSRENILSSFKQFSLRMFMVSSAIAATVCIFASQIITVFLGSAFIPSVGFVHVLIWKIIPLSLSFLWSRYLIAASQQNKDVLALIIGLLIFFVLSILFVRRWGTIGMAYADVLTIIALALIHLHFVNRLIFLTGEKA